MKGAAQTKKSGRPEGGDPEEWAAGVRTRMNSKRAFWRSPSFQTPSKFHEKTPREHKGVKCQAGGGSKKREILGGPAEGVVQSTSRGQGVWEGCLAEGCRRKGGGEGSVEEKKNENQKDKLQKQKI